MERLVAFLADALIAGGAQSENRDIYIYALDSLLSTLLMITVFVIIGIVTSSLTVVIFWQIALIALRTPMGGYHASTHLRCQLLSYGLAILSILLTRYLANAALVLSLLTLVIACWIAPVIHPDQPQSAKERKRARKLAIGIAVGESLAVASLLGFGNPTIATAIALGGACASIPGLYAKLKNDKTCVGTH